MNSGLNDNGVISELKNKLFRINPKNINTERLSPVDNISVVNGGSSRFSILTKKYPGKIVRKIPVEICLMIGISKYIKRKVRTYTDIPIIRSFFIL